MVKKDKKLSGRDSDMELVKKSLEPIEFCEDGESYYYEEPDVGGFICTLCIFIASITSGLWLDMLYNIEGVIWAFPIVTVSSVVGLFALEKRNRRLELGRKKAFIKLKRNKGKC